MFSFEHVLVHLMTREDKDNNCIRFNEDQPVRKEVEMTLPVNDAEPCRVRQGHAPV